MKPPITRIDREINRLYAAMFGYFWKSCDVCGEMFGGHECGNGQLILKRFESGRSGRILCWKHDEDYELVEGKIQRVIEVDHTIVRFSIKSKRWMKFPSIRECFRLNPEFFK